MCACLLPSTHVTQTSGLLNYGVISKLATQQKRSYKHLMGVYIIWPCFTTLHSELQPLFPPECLWPGIEQRDCKPCYLLALFHIQPSVFFRETKLRCFCWGYASQKYMWVTRRDKIQRCVSTSPRWICLRAGNNTVKNISSSAYNSWLLTCLKLEFWNWINLAVHL